METGIFRQIKKSHFEKSLIKMDSLVTKFELVFIKKFDHFSKV